MTVSREYVTLTHNKVILQNNGQFRDTKPTTTDSRTKMACNKGHSAH